MGALSLDVMMRWGCAVDVRVKWRDALGTWIYRLALASTLAVGANIPVAVAECARTYFLDQYRAGVALVQRKQVSTAADIFRPLAEQGFSPAQRRLGEFLLTQPNGRSEALTWLNLAHINGDEMAIDVIKAAQPTAEDSLAIDAQIRSFQPRSTECMQEFRERWLNGRNVQMTEIVGKVLMPPPATPEAAGQFAGMITAIAKARPDMVPYIRALPTVVIVPSEIFALSGRFEDRTVLIVDRDTLAKPDPTRIGAFLKAAVEAIRTVVHDQADPLERLTATYKGRRIVAIGHADAGQALADIKAGIDAAETLPPDLRRLAEVVREIRYESPQWAMDARTFSTYSAKGKFAIFRRNAGRISVRDAVGGLVAAGIFAEAQAQGNGGGIELSESANYQAWRAKTALP